MPLVWNEKLSVGVKGIDDQHKVLVDLINKVEVLAQIDPNEILFPKKFRELSSGLLNYTFLHFTTEEVLMEMFDYQGYKSHKNSHETFIVVAKMRIKNCTNLLLHAKHSELQQELDFIFQFLGDWVVNHILKSDAEYIQFFLSIRTKAKSSGGWLSFLGRK